MTIAQISDLHLGAGRDRGVDPAANFASILEDVAGRRVDLIVLTGDLVQEENDEESYALIKRLLEARRLPHRIVPGNHDSRAALARIFGQAPAASGELYREERFGDARLLFLDSSRSSFSEAQWRWLEERMTAPGPTPVLFMHHPPLPAGVPVMDRDWRFLEPEEFRERVLTRTESLIVFCGHCHTEKTVRRPGLDMYLCPAVNYQFDPTAPEVRIESLRFGWRKIEIDPSLLATSVRWIGR